jgi:hypothetical protein
MAEKRATLSHEVTKDKIFYFRKAFFVFSVPPCEN